MPSATKWCVKNYSLILIEGWWYHYEDGDLLVGGWTTHLKNMLVKLENLSPNIGLKIPKIFEPPPTSLPLWLCLFFFRKWSTLLSGGSQKFHVLLFCVPPLLCTKMLRKPTKKIGSLKIAGIQNSFGNLLLQTCWEKKHSWSSPQRSTRLCTLGCLRMRDLMFFQTEQNHDLQRLTWLTIHGICLYRLLSLSQKKWNHHFLGPTPTARWQKWWVHSPRQDSPWLHNRSWSYHKHGRPTKHPSRNPIKHNVPLNNLRMKTEKKTERVENWNLTSKTNNASHLMSEFLWVNQLEGVSSRFIWRPVTLLLQIWQHCLTKLRLKGGNYSTLKVCIWIASCRSFCADCPKNVHHPSHLIKNGLLIRRCSIRFR